MSRYVLMTVGSATLVYNFLYLAGLKQGDPRGWRCLKTTGTNTPSNQTKQSKS